MAIPRGEYFGNDDEKCIMYSYKLKLHLVSCVAVVPTKKVQNTFPQVFRSVQNILSGGAGC